MCHSTTSLRYGASVVRQLCTDSLWPNLVLTVSLTLVVCTASYFVLRYRARPWLPRHRLATNA
jgi:hypothetical protein